ncbi:DUF3147 family protein [Vibrio sp. 404]|uniref:DUF3147 family protein n=1 Tax=Vibrio marinisediminis TaxID=2758441 RepID=A0A7W2FPD4_9VIBR|nr:DUF3147 family protein [Vibrio marinisediminis]MBA5761682.1 DUF3147 family protein [Vibrio marinisediminis]
MLWLVFKYLTTAAIVVAISEIAKRSDKVGALVAALPTVTILALIWMYIENQGNEKLSNHAFYTFWYVLPTLPMFLLFPYLLSKYSFWFTLLMSCLVSIMCFALTHLIAKQFGINLL